MLLLFIWCVEWENVRTRRRTTITTTKRRRKQWVELLISATVRICFVKFCPWIISENLTPIRNEQEISRKMRRVLLKGQKWFSRFECSLYQMIDWLIAWSLGWLIDWLFHWIVSHLIADSTIFNIALLVLRVIVVAVVKVTKWSPIVFLCKLLLKKKMVPLKTLMMKMKILMMMVTKKEK